MVVVVAVAVVVVIVLAVLLEDFVEGLFVVVAVYIQLCT